MDAGGRLVGLIEAREAKAESVEASDSGTGAATNTRGRAHLDQGRLYLEQALSLDEQGRGEDALPLYITAVQQYLDGMKVAGANDTATRTRVTEVLDRIETLRKIASL